MILALVFVRTGIGIAEDKAQADKPPALKGETGEDKEKLSEWQHLFRKHAADYKISVAGNETSEVKLVSDPVLQWSQPVRGGADGAVFVWAQDGRPTVIGTLFIWPAADGKIGVAHELHSLSELPLTAKWNNRTWSPPKDAVVWKSIPDAPKPAATPEQRLRQMRDLARLFQAQSHDKSDRKWELRLLPRPLYRPGQSLRKSTGDLEEEIVDSALFGFVEGTDLEVVLLLETHNTATGPQWQCAFARMSDFRLQASLRGKTVWEADPSGYDMTQLPYYCTTVEYLPPTDK